jgi:hypothetical protein
MTTTLPPISSSTFDRFLKKKEGGRGGFLREFTLGILLLSLTVYVIHHTTTYGAAASTEEGEDREICSPVRQTPLIPLANGHSISYSFSNPPNHNLEWSINPPRSPLGDWLTFKDFAKMIEPNFFADVELQMDLQQPYMTGQMAIPRAHGCWKQGEDDTLDVCNVYKLPITKTAYLEFIQDRGFPRIRTFPNVLGQSEWDVFKTPEFQEKVIQFLRNNIDIKQGVLLDDQLSPTPLTTSERDVLFRKRLGDNPILQERGTDI